MLVIRSLLFGLMEFITLGYLFAYMQKIATHSAHGEDEIHGGPELPKCWSDFMEGRCVTQVAESRYQKVLRRAPGPLKLPRLRAHGPNETLVASP